MKNKNYLLSLLTILVTAAMSLSLMSCSNDDDNGNGNNNQSDASKSLIGNWNISGIVVLYDWQAGEIIYNYTGRMAITSKSISLNFEEAETGDYGVMIPSRMIEWSCVGNTIEWIGTYGAGSEIFTYSLSDDKNTLTMTFSSGEGIGDYLFKTITAKRVNNDNTPSTQIDSSLKGIWYSASQIVDGIETPINKYKDENSDGILDTNSLYQEIEFKDNGKALFYTWSGDDTFDALPFAYKTDGNTVTADFEDFIGVSDENGTVLRHIFTYEPKGDILLETNIPTLIWHTYIRDDDVIIGDLYVKFKKR